MEWDEAFALLTAGASAPYAIELAATWFKKSSWPVFHPHKGAKTQG